MKAIVAEYEDAMKKMIVELQQLRATKANDDIANMNKRLVKELSQLEQSYSDLKSRFDDIKVINEGLRKVCRERVYSFFCRQKNCSEARFLLLRQTSRETGKNTNLFGF